MQVWGLDRAESKALYVYQKLQDPRAAWDRKSIMCMHADVLQCKSTMITILIPIFFLVYPAQDLYLDLTLPSLHGHQSRSQVYTDGLKQSNLLSLNSGSNCAFNVYLL